MKKFLLFITMLFCLSAMKAQTISVASFKQEEMDLTANQQGTIVLDQNGEKCALIKVITTQTGLSFDNGSLGIQKTIQKSGEIWVYVPFGTRKISIAHPQIGQLRDWTIPVKIEKARTYVMQLVMGNVKTIIEQDDGKSYFSLTVTPPNATVLIDGTLQALDNSGNIMLRMSRGQHTYDIQAAGYSPVKETFELGVDKISKNIKLESQFAAVDVSCPTSGSDIFINDALKGKNRWSGMLMPGDYLFEARKEGYYTQKQSVSLSEKEKKTIVIPELIARTGQLDVAYKPADCEIFLDGVKLGTSPDLFKNIVVGGHKIKITKEGYDDVLLSVEIKDGEVARLSGELQPTKVAFTSSASKPKDQSTSGTLNGHEWVDLGLSVKWATCNVGALVPSDYGNYYAWGETSTKSHYDWKNCFDCVKPKNLDKETGWRIYKQKGMTRILPDSGHDAAHANWRGTWRMPTDAEFEELCKKCQWTCEEKDGKKGFTVTGPNGNSIFLPAAGYRYGSNSHKVNEALSYWSNTLSSYKSKYALYLYMEIYNKEAKVYFTGRAFGQTVRPVTE